MPKRVDTALESALMGWKLNCPVTLERERMGWSRRRLCEESGVSEGTINNVERGRTSNITTWEKLSHSLGKSPRAFVKQLTDWWFERPTTETAADYLEKVMN